MVPPMPAIDPSELLGKKFLVKAGDSEHPAGRISEVAVDEKNARLILTVDLLPLEGQKWED